MEYIHIQLHNLSVQIALFSFFIIAGYLLYRYFKKSNHSSEYNEKLFLRITSDIADQAVAIFSKEHKVIYSSHHIRKFININTDDIISKTQILPMIKIEDNWMTVQKFIDRYLDKAFNQTIYITHAAIKAQDEEKLINIRCHSFSKYNDKNPNYLSISIFDVTNKLELSKIYYQNTTSGLPNHNKAIVDIGHMTSKMQSLNKSFALIVISIDNFPNLVSILGYKQSISAITSIGKYFNDISKELDLSLYHMTNNNFLIMVPNIQSSNEPLSLVEKFKKDTNNLLYSNNTNLHITISSGISIFPNVRSSDLLNSAYRALAKANIQGDGYSVISDKDSMNINDKKDEVMLGELRRALKDGEITMYFQPIYNLKDKSIVGAEALMRWIHPKRGIIPPDSFILLAEKTGFISDLGKFAAANVISQLAIWNQLEFKRAQISINLSLREIESSNPHEYLSSLLEKYKVKASQIKIEVTENIAMNNQEKSFDQFSKLRSLGVEISLDDFGTGYSSFSLLESLPISTAKIDKSFILDLAKSRNHQVIVKAMIAMTHAMGIKVIAEGIEDEKSAKILSQYGCDYVQGYYFGRPMPSYEFQKLIRSNKQEIRSDNVIRDLY